MAASYWRLGKRLEEDGERNSFMFVPIKWWSTVAIVGAIFFGSSSFRQQPTAVIDQTQGPFEKPVQTTSVHARLDGVGAEALSVLQPPTPEVPAKTNRVSARIE
jgi:hypothetical protein